MLNSLYAQRPFVFDNKNKPTYVTTWTFLISGIGNVIGKVSLGMICDMKWSNTVIVFALSQFGLAASIAIYPIAYSYVVLVLASLSFGFFYGNYCAIPSLLVQFVGLNNLAEAIGYINFLEGVSGIVGPPLAGRSWNITIESVTYSLHYHAFALLGPWSIRKHKSTVYNREWAVTFPHFLIFNERVQSATTSTSFSPMLYDV